MPSPASAEPKFEFLRGALGTFGKRGVSRLILFGEQSLRRAGDALFDVVPAEMKRPSVELPHVHIASSASVGMNE